MENQRRARSGKLQTIVCGRRALVTRVNTSQNITFRLWPDAAAAVYTIRTHVVGITVLGKENRDYDGRSSQHNYVLPNIDDSSIFDSSVFRIAKTTYWLENFFFFPFFFLQIKNDDERSTIILRVLGSPREKRTTIAQNADGLF